jgi:CheY-like chemotaxis protein
MQLQLLCVRSGSTASGEEAIEMIRQSVAECDPFTIALLDNHTGDIDGFALARKIKADHQIASTRLVLVSSVRMQSDQAALDEVGIEAWFAKPIRQSDLQQWIAGAGSRAKEPPPENQVRAPENGDMESKESSDSLQSNKESESLRILLAEDSAVNQRIAVSQIRKLGHRVDVVTNGADAVDTLARTDYDLVFMDCYMPEMDGYQATAEIRRREGTSKHTPIIAMTGNSTAGDREICLEAGMDDYISKPFSREALVDVINRWAKASPALSEASEAEFA